jgi:hypothetical protein
MMVFHRLVDLPLLLGRERSRAVIADEEAVCSLPIHLPANPTPGTIRPPSLVCVVVNEGRVNPPRRVERLEREGDLPQHGESIV